VFGWFVRQGSQARWAREQALPEIQRLVEQEQYITAFGLANEAKRYIATDPIWNRLDPLISHPLSVTTAPPGNGWTIHSRRCDRSGKRSSG